MTDGNEKPAAGTAGVRQATVTSAKPTAPPAETSSARASHRISCPDFPLPEPAVCRARITVATRGGALMSAAWDALVDAISGRPLMARCGARETVLPPSAVATARAVLHGTVLDEAGRRLVWLCAVRLDGDPGPLAVAWEHAGAAGSVALHWRTPGTLWAVLAAEPSAAEQPAAIPACLRLAQSWAPQARCTLAGAGRWVPLAIDPEAGPKRTCWVWPLASAELATEAGRPASAPTPAPQPPPSPAPPQASAEAALEDALDAWDAAWAGGRP